MNACTHDLAERETAVAADGMCPICLQRTAAAFDHLREFTDAILDRITSIPKSGVAGIFYKPEIKKDTVDRWRGRLIEIDTEALK